MAETSRRDEAPVESIGANDLAFDAAFQKRLEALTIVARRSQTSGARAERRSRSVGSGIAFADHRPYAPGDDFRALDWSVYQRSRKLLVRLFEEEEDLSVYVLLDVSGSMAYGTPPKLSLGKELAAALAYVGLVRLDRVSIAAISDRVVGRLAPTRGKNRIFRAFDFLAPLRASGPTDLDRAARAFVAETKRRGVILLISDFYDPNGFEAAINRFRFARFETHVLHLVDPSEARPALHGDLRLVDEETEAFLDVTATPALITQHERAYAAYRHRLETFSGEKHVAYHAVDVRRPFEDTVLRVLRREGLVG